jgi:hypothetical protein
MASKSKTKSQSSSSRVGKDTKVSFPISVVCWVDLLGYGSAMAAAGFNPLHPQAKGAIARLRRFHRIVSEHSARHFPTLVMNDGAAAYRDLSLRTSSTTYDFLWRAWELHRDILADEFKTGDPGARMVIAAGFRMLGRRAGLDDRGRQVKEIIERLDDGEITKGQAIAEGERLRTTFDVVPQLQANFAFTKAYLAEQSGRKGGLGGPKCFVDSALFASPPPFLELGDMVAWEHTKLGVRADFAPILNFQRDHSSSPPASLRNGLEVGVHMTNDPELLSALMAARKS